MTRYLITSVTVMLICTAVKAQSLTLIDLLGQLDRSFEQTEAFIKPMHFKKSQDNNFLGVRTITYDRQIGNVRETIGKSLKDSSTGRAPGINYMYDQRSFTDTLRKQMKPFAFKLWRTWTKGGKTSWDYISPRYEVVIDVYDDTNTFTTFQVTWVDERKL